MSVSDVPRDGLALHLHDEGGSGRPVVLEHGLMGNAGQIAELPASGAMRRITLDCRGHGGSGAGDAQAFSISTFADDVIAAIEQQRLGPVVIGGISMGAAIATRIAVIRPDLVSGLILIRPAWVCTAAPDNMRPNAEVGDLLTRYPPDEARARFEASETAALLARDAPDNLASLMSFFDRTPIDVTAALLSRISLDGPGITDADLSRIAVPALIVGTARDLVHPFAHARALAAAIPGASLHDITPKATNKARHLADLGREIAAFLSTCPKDTRR